MVRPGWIEQWGRILQRFKATLDFFSVGQLMSTLFAPFRQISTSPGSDGSFASVMRGFVDKLISRIIGAIVRTGTILVGLLVILFQALYVVALMIIWWFLPLFPIAGLILFVIGWVPSWR